MQKKAQQQIQIELDEKAAQGTYSNFVLTGNTPSEFILDFARMLPGLKKARVLSRIVMTPQSAKSLLMVLTRTVEQYEKNYGKITIQGAKAGTQIGFQADPAGAKLNKEEKKH
ncbi:MAG: DUF3467 domain-containing protein [Candidatus Krumholzibacteriota bacterium]|nr:DUF3467 domain-containing protein [Candidatus Krumholzibacteriota bacterium]